VDSFLWRIILCCIRLVKKNKLFDKPYIVNSKRCLKKRGRSISERRNIVPEVGSVPFLD